MIDDNFIKVMKKHDNTMALRLISALIECSYRSGFMDAILMIIDDKVNPLEADEVMEECLAEFKAKYITSVALAKAEVNSK